MTSHLTDEMLVDALEGIAPGDARRHLEQCAARLADAREGLAGAHDADVPEPSPLYWEAFRRQVGRRLDEAPARKRFLWWVPVLAGGLAVVVGAVVLRPTPPPPAAPSVATLPAWSALPPSDQDDGLAVLQAFASEGAPLEAALPSSGVASDLSDLSDEESQVLADALRRELKGGESL